MPLVRKMQGKTMKSRTNITPEMREAFDALVSDEYDNFCLVSCFVDGKPTAVICAYEEMDDEEIRNLTPLFVAVTDDMVITDHDGNPTERKGLDS
jgi:hypothetical protein